MSRFVIPYSNGIILFLILIVLDKKASCSHSKIINIFKGLSALHPTRCIWLPEGLSEPETGVQASWAEDKIGANSSKHGQEIEHGIILWRV